MAGRNNIEKNHYENEQRALLRRMESNKEHIMTEKIGADTIERARQILLDSNVGDINVLWRNKCIYNGNLSTTTTQQLCDVAIRAHGILAVMCRILGVYRTDLILRIEKEPKVKRMIAEQREDIIDMAECRLFEATSEGREWAVKFTLQTLGRKRGYSDDIIPKDNRGLILDVIESAIDDSRLLTDDIDWEDEINTERLTDETS